MALIEFRDVSFKDGDTNVIDNISFEIEDGDFALIVGPSGGGKSSLLKLISDLISPTSGDRYFSGKEYMEYDPINLRNDIVYLFQTPYLFGDTVLDNMKFVYDTRKEELDLDRVKKLFRTFDMDESYINRKVQNLSGGEKQRISLIRSLLFVPKVILLDEITSALDSENSDLVEKIIEKISDDGTTILWVTHSPEKSRKYANKIITIDSGKLVDLEVINE